jgi:hypothetical protein
VISGDEPLTDYPVDRQGNTPRRSGKLNGLLVWVVVMLVASVIFPGVVVGRQQRDIRALRQATTTTQNTASENKASTQVAIAAALRNLGCDVPSVAHGGNFVDAAEGTCQITGKP